MQAAEEAELSVCLNCQCNKCNIILALQVFGGEEVQVAQEAELLHMLAAIVLHVQKCL
jgi:hypothetical protein